ncbi:MAG: SusC/RagA family TonB-linked outer membrane protein [Bacteroidales bacterium]|nr:SusC/RagA family TonB-linked outer membrane protein [Bacteroidales bacterium]
MRKFTILFAFLLFAGMQSAFAQLEVKGSVNDAADGTPLPGVSITVKGTLAGVITDAQGKYAINVPRGYNDLIFSFVGMKTVEVKIDGRAVIDVQMAEDVVGLDEVVVTALGITRERKSLGYSVQEASGEDIARTANPNLQTAIAGKFAGVEVRQSSGMPGSPTQIYIRGARSFSGDNTPLYVVDGMPIISTPDYSQNVTGAYYSNRALDINPDDIESINVLKGQAAAALYGLRASNGVIIITTKKGKTSAAGRPVQVSLSTNFATDMVSRLPDVNQTYAQGYYEDFYPAFSYSWGPRISDLPDIPVYGGNNYEGKEGLFFDPYKGEWVTPTAYNNPKEFYNKNGTTFNNNINVSGVTKDGNYAIGFGATNQNGIVPNTGMDRYNAKAAGEFNISDKLKTGFSGNFSNASLQKLPSGNSSWLFTVYGAPASFDLMGTPYHQEGTNGPYRQISYRRGAVGENPRWALENNYFHEATMRFFGNIFFEYAPVSWMNVRYQLGTDTYSTDNEDLYQMGSAGTGQVLPAGSGYPTPDNPVYRYYEPTGGSINNYGVIRKMLNSLLNITFTKRFSDDFGGLLIVGNEVSDMRTRYWNMLGTGFSLPGWNNMSNTTTQTASESKYWDRTVGFYGSLNLDFRSMLFLTLTGRYDMVSSMPRDNRGFFYPSVGLGWVFTELEGLQNNTTFSFGKIRGSYAEVGQAGTYRDNVYVTGGAGSGFLNDGILFPLGGVSGYKPSRTIYDPNLVPQNTRTWEIGLELKFFQNRLGIDYAYSDQLAIDQIFGVPMAGSTGYGTFVTNAGKMSSKVHEIVLNATPVKGNNFNWDFLINFTKVNNVCIELAEGVESISLGGYVTPNIRASAGDTYPAIYGNQFLRDDQGRILVDENPDSYYYGMPLQGDFGKIGDVTPDFIISMSNYFTFFKWITLGLQLDWKQGGQMYSGSNRLMDLYGSSARTEDRTTPYIYDGYKADGTPNDIQRGGPEDIWAYPDLYSDIFGDIGEANVYETSFIKFRDISLTFQLPRKVIDPIKLQGLSVTLFARNIFLWSTLPNFDPEASQGMGNMQAGMDYMSLPQTSSFGIGLNLTF